MAGDIIQAVANSLQQWAEADASRIVKMTIWNNEAAAIFSLRPHKLRLPSQPHQKLFRGGTGEGAIYIGLDLPASLPWEGFYSAVSSRIESLRDSLLVETAAVFNLKTKKWSKEDTVFGRLLLSVCREIARERRPQSNDSMEQTVVEARTAVKEFPTFRRRLLDPSCALKTVRSLNEEIEKGISQEQAIGLLVVEREGKNRKSAIERIQRFIRECESVDTERQKHFKNVRDASDNRLAALKLAILDRPCLLWSMAEWVRKYGMIKYTEPRPPGEWVKIFCRPDGIPRKSNWFRTQRESQKIRSINDGQVKVRVYEADLPDWAGDRQKRDRLAKSTKDEMRFKLISDFKHRSDSNLNRS